VQKSNLELSVKTALNRVYSHNEFEANDIVDKCLIPFPHIWVKSENFKLGNSAFYGLELETTGNEGLVFNKEDRKPTAMHVMTLPTIQNLTIPELNHHQHLILAVILILRHATVLRLSNSSSESALTNVELAYRETNIDLKIQQHLMASSQGHSVELFAAFIMATDIVPSQFFCQKTGLNTFFGTSIHVQV